MIIGIVGFINSGKGTVGTLLQNHYGFKTESFAKPLKDAVSNIFGWDRGMLEGADGYREWREREDPRWSAALNRPGFSPRLALQLMGTEAGRQVFGESLWTTSCILRCQKRDTWETPGGAIENFVITDCRFRNEIKSIKDVNGVIIRVKRGEEPNWYEGAALGPILADADRLVKLSSEKWEALKYKHLVEFMTNYNSGCIATIHQSEWDWVGADFDYLVENDGTVADLQTKVYDILVDLKLTHKPFQSSKAVREEQ